MAEIDSAGLLDADPKRDVKLKSFAPDELLTCEKCLRANPPTRSECLYCAAPLSSNATILSKETEAEPQPAALSTTCYAVVAPKALREVDENLLEQLARTIQLKSSDLQTALDSHSPLLASGTYEKTSQTLTDLRKSGIDGLLVTDADLKLSVDNRTIRALECTGEGLI